MVETSGIEEHNNLRKSTPEMRAAWRLYIESQIHCADGSVNAVAVFGLNTLTDAEGLLAEVRTLESELARLRNMDPGEFEDEYMAAHPFVCDWCVAGSAEKCEATHGRFDGGCLTMVRSKCRGTKFYCSCEWRSEAK